MMTTAVYLVRLDEQLSAGAARLPEAFRRQQAEFLVRCQAPGGGFLNRRGREDLYYTRFGLAALAVLGAREPVEPWGRAGEFVRDRPDDLAGLADSLSLLDSIRILEARGVPLFCCQERRSLRYQAVRECVDACRSADGGFGLTPGGPPGPYGAFLGVLCRQLMGDPVSDAAALTRSVLSCAAADGGFAESPDRTHGQTNPTAAAVAVLGMLKALDPAMARGAACYLESVCGEDGGLRAHAATKDSDLLSTFVGLATAQALGQLRAMRLGGIARFVRSLAAADGGFRGAAGDDVADAEYTFYGLGSLALLAAAAK